MQIWQGTILGGGGGPLPGRKLEISADCDLANDKGGGEFFALDILRAEEFTRQRLVVPRAGLNSLVWVRLRRSADTMGHCAPSGNAGECGHAGWPRFDFRQKFASEDPCTARDACRPRITLLLPAGALK